MKKFRIRGTWYTVSASCIRAALIKLVDSDGDLKYETETISTSFVTYFPSDNPSIAIAITSPNISYKNKQTSYIYPFNKMVISRLTNYFLN